MKYLMVLLGITMPFWLFSQTPLGISYQAVARYQNGDCISNQDISIRIRIRDAAANGPILYQEQHIEIPTNDQGLFSLILKEFEIKTD